MIIDSKDHFDFMVNNEITANQFLLCYLLLEDEHPPSAGDAHPIGKVYEYSEKVKKWNRAEIDDLISKGLLKDRNPDKPQRDYPDHLIVTEKFKEAVWNHDSNFEEFWEEYPGFVDNFKNPTGPKVKLKAVVKEEMELMYRRIVKSNKLHKRVMKALLWAKEHNKINMNIKNWIGSREWENIEKEMKDYGESKNQQVI